MDKQATKKFRVVLTRENNSAVAEILRSKGGIEVVEMPLIKIERNVEDADFADIMEEMGTYDWITFSSANGVRHFCGCLEQGRDFRFLDDFPDFRWRR